ncbi:MAG: GyrI-like domain-containing protein [Chloroflexota bacterium]|jgi:effector-binding domain-containing protein
MPDPRGPSSKIELRVLRSHHTATMRSEVDASALSLEMGRVMQAVKEALDKQGVKGTSAPFARYHSFGDTVDFEAGMMVDAPIAPDGSVQPSQLPSGPAAIAVHAGPYDTLGTTYAAMNRWLEASPDYVANGGPWELYLTDPSAEPDPHKWLTEVIYPLKPSS